MKGERCGTDEKISLLTEALSRHPRDYCGGLAEGPSGFPPSPIVMQPGRIASTAGAIAALAALDCRCAPDTGAPAGRLYEVRGARLYVETRGSGAPLVFLAGGLHYFGNSFEAQTDYFARSRTVIGIDQRGHGHSPDTPQPFSYRDMAEDTAAVIERLGLAKVDVVGHSDGGDVGLCLARYHPGLVRRLVISGANLASGRTPADTERLAHYTYPEIIKALPPIIASWGEDYARVSPDGAAHWSTVVAKDWLLWLTPVVLDAAELKAIDIPVLVMAGDRDLIPLDETLKIFHGLPRGQLLIIPGTWHNTFQARPDIVNPAIERFLDEADPARPH